MALHVRVVSPVKVVYEGEASSVVAPAWDGEVGVRINLMTDDERLSWSFE